MALNFSRSRRRWGDNDKHVGPFTFSLKEQWRHFAILLASGEDEYPGCSLRVSAFGNTMIVALPQIIKPHVSWVDLSYAEWAKAGPDGRKGYTQVDQREYGISLSDGHLSVSLGRKTHDSSTEQRWGWFLPWRQWRHVRHSFYGLDGKIVATIKSTGRRYTDGQWERERAIADATPTVSFEFDDFDGERIVARTKIEEREWRLGEGRFKWLSLFRRPRISRSLDIEFSKETGKRKGSWKGGTFGHAINMTAGELHERAFRRYCAENNMTFVAVQEPPHGTD